MSLGLKTLINGYAGSGKSYLGLTFPKIAWCITEPGSEILLETHPELKKNVVLQESFIPSPLEDIKVTFERLDKWIIEAHKLAKEGKLETLNIDNGTFLIENRWIYINKHDKAITKSGAVDTQSMYGELHRWAYRYTLMNILTFPGNVNFMCHEQHEEEKNEKGELVPTGNVLPQILGGFREKVDGLFSASIYLDKKRKPDGTYDYIARCQKGGGRNAKNRYGLPEFVNNVSYDTIVKSIKKGAN